MGVNPEWVEAGARAMVRSGVSGNTATARVVIAAVEPLIRADEREKYQCPMPCCDEDTQ